MLCTSPFVRGLAAYPCGQCQPCRINRRRLWTHRLLLEQAKHEASSFITLTYDKANLPVGGTLVPKHTQLWLKRLRERLRPIPVRFFLVGEYGDETWRPHYHAALFGLGPHGSQEVQETWNMGFTSVGLLTAQSAAYVAGYVTKKMTSHQDPRLQGRHPEFCRMSLKPGIGASAMQDVANALNCSEGAEVMAHERDVPAVLMHGRKLLPLGRYLRDRLRQEVGADAFDAANSRLVMEQTAKNKELRDAVGRTAFRFLKPMVEHERARQVVARANIWKKKESL